MMGRPRKRLVLLHKYPMPREAADRAANGLRVTRGMIGDLECAYYEFQSGLDASNANARCKKQLPPPHFIQRLV